MTAVVYIVLMTAALVLAVRHDLRVHRKEQSSYRRARDDMRWEAEQRASRDSRRGWS